MPVQPGDTVRVHYTGTLSDQRQFDSSAGREPLEFTAGVGQVVPGFDAAVLGMEPGEAKTVTIPADQAYGAVDPEQQLVVPREQMPDGDVSVGDRLQLGMPDGGAVVVRVVEMDEASVTLDANHELAGEDLTFDIELVEIA